MEVCKGNGECLRQSEYENEYYTDPNMICIHKCEPVKCKNFEFCGRLFQNNILIVGVEKDVVVIVMRFLVIGMVVKAFLI